MTFGLYFNYKNCVPIIRFNKIIEQAYNNKTVMRILMRTSRKIKAVSNRVF